MAFLYSAFLRKMLTSWSLRGRAPPLYKRDHWWGSLEPWCICCSRQAGQVWWLQPSILATLKTEARESSQVQSQPELQSESPSHPSYRVRLWQKVSRVEEMNHLAVSVMHIWDSEFRFLGTHVKLRCSGTAVLWNRVREMEIGRHLQLTGQLS